MTLTEFADVTQTEIHIRYSPGAVGPWISDMGKSFVEVFFKENSSDIMARSCPGWGKTPHDSLVNLVKNINTSGVKLLVVVRGEDRQTFGVPLITGI